MSSISEDIVIQALKGYNPQTNERGKILFKDICYIYPATLDDIQAIGFSIFMKYLGILIGGKPIFKSEEIGEELKQLFDNIDDFQFLLLRATMDKNGSDELKRVFNFFIHEEVTVLPEFGIVIGPISEQRILRQEDFQEFVSIVQFTHYAGPGEDDIILKDSDTPHVRQLKLQQIENRKKIAEAKKRQGKGQDIQLSDLIASLAAKGENGLSLLNIWNLSYYGFQDQLRRLNMIEEYDMKTRAAMAGAKIKKEELKHWMQHLSPKDKK